ncbi:MAG: 9-O-acetyl-N-acetylneuraminate esterase, partial [Lachnospiraceae bacterium]
MPKVFNVTADCKPQKHYMVKLGSRLTAIKKLVDEGDYFTINRARQYGKTTTLRALSQYLQVEYMVVLMDFQTISHAKFASENLFALTFAKLFLRSLKINQQSKDSDLREAIEQLEIPVKEKSEDFELPELFEHLSDICASSDRPIVLM